MVPMAPSSGPFVCQSNSQDLRPLTYLLLKNHKGVRQGDAWNEVARGSGGPQVLSPLTQEGAAPRSLPLGALQKLPDIDSLIKSPVSDCWPVVTSPRCPCPPWRPGSYAESLSSDRLTGLPGNQFPPTCILCRSPLSIRTKGISIT